MSTFTYKLEIGDTFSRLELSGLVEFEEILLVMKDLLNSADYTRPYLLWDVRKAYGDVSFNEMMQLRDFSVKNRGDLGYGRTAFLVSDDLHFGLARMYQSISEDLPYDVEIFYRAAEAAHWLKG